MLNFALAIDFAQPEREQAVIGDRPGFEPRSSFENLGAGAQRPIGDSRQRPLAGTGVNRPGTEVHLPGTEEVYGSITGSITEVHGPITLPYVPGVQQTPKPSPDTSLKAVQKSLDSTLSALSERSSRSVEAGNIAASLIPAAIDLCKNVELYLSAMVPDASADKSRNLRDFATLLGRRQVPAHEHLDVKAQVQGHAALATLRDLPWEDIADIFDVRKLRSGADGVRQMLRAEHAVDTQQMSVGDVEVLIASVGLIRSQLQQINDPSIPTSYDVPERYDWTSAVVRIGFATIIGGALGGGVGALVVKEAIVEEVVKSAIASFVGAAGMEVLLGLSDRRSGSQPVEVFQSRHHRLISAMTDYGSVGAPGSPDEVRLARARVLIDLHSLHRAQWQVDLSGRDTGYRALLDEIGKSARDPGGRAGIIQNVPKLRTYEYLFSDLSESKDRRASRLRMFPVRVKSGMPRWTAAPEWRTASEKVLVAERERVAEEYRQCDGELLRRQEEARSAAENYETLLLAGTGESLRSAVKRALTELGFVVQDWRNAPDGPGVPFIVTDPSAPEWVAIADTEGSTTGLSSTTFERFTAYLFAFFDDAKRKPDALWLVVNEYANQEPTSRLGLSGDLAGSIRTFSTAAGLLVESVVLFETLQSVRDGGSAAQMRERLRVMTGVYNEQAN